jgi:hypothetical protein
MKISINKKGTIEEKVGDKILDLSDSKTILNAGGHPFMFTFDDDRLGLLVGSKYAYIPQIQGVPFHEDFEDWDV